MSKHSRKHSNLGPRPWLSAWVITPWLLSAGLLCWVGWVSFHGKAVTAPQPPPAPSSELMAPVRAHIPQPVITAAKEFDWSELDSPDFPTFIQRLRHVHCPEATIRDIVKGELEEIYADKRKSLRGGDARGRNALAKEEADLLEGLLAGPIDRGVGSTVAAGSSPDVPQNRPPRLRSGASGPPIMPLAFQTIETGSGNQALSAAQLSALENLKAEFVAELGGGQVDPASEEYAQRWRAAQPMLDQRLQALMGHDWTTKLGIIRAATR